MIICLNSHAGSRTTRATALIAALVTAFCTGCIGFTDGTVDPPDGDGSSPNDIVTVRLVNLNDTEAVDVELFATNTPVTVLPDELFVGTNRIQASIGVAGTGILEPLGEDSLILTCTDSLTLGTSGGTFLDNETGDVLGMGQARWAQDAPLGLCGGTVTLVFRQDDEGFQTVMLVGF